MAPSHRRPARYPDDCFEYHAAHDANPPLVRKVSTFRTPGFHAGFLAPSPSGHFHTGRGATSGKWIELPSQWLRKRLSPPSQAHPLHPRVSQRILGRLTRDVKTHPEHWVNIKNYESGKKEIECRPSQRHRSPLRSAHSRRRPRAPPRLRASDLRRLGKAVPKRDAHRHELILPAKPTAHPENIQAGRRCAQPQKPSIDNYSLLIAHYQLSPLNYNALPPPVPIA